MTPSVSQASSALTNEQLDGVIGVARRALLAEQRDDGHWCYELEADCTIPAEYILLMHFMDEIDDALAAKMANYLRAHQLEEGGWPLYTGGDVDLSCSVKAYYALKLAGEDIDTEPMRRARDAILLRGGAARANVFTRIALAQFAQVPWRAVPFIPVEVMLLPRWFPFHLDKVAYWSRTVMVPLFILCTLKPMARNPRGIEISELFLRPPAEERDYFPVRSPMNRAYLALDRFGRRLEPLIPRAVRRRALRAAEAWIVARLNGENGLGAIFPAMVNAYAALAALGYPASHPLRQAARRAIDALVVERQHDAYCQPCVSPVWDTGLACHALIEAGAEEDRRPLREALDWLDARQIRAAGDWSANRAHLEGGGWAFQYGNDAYPDLDDTALVAWAMQRFDRRRYRETVTRAADWVRDMQSANGGYAAFDADNTHEHLNEIPFADHGALLDPPTADVSARVATLLASLDRDSDRAAMRRCLGYLSDQQEREGAWYGRWGTNYVYGTWSVLMALREAGVGSGDPRVRRAVDWLARVQREDGGWGEDNDTYFEGTPRKRAYRSNQGSTACQTAWAVLALICGGAADSAAVARGVDYLIRTQRQDGLWHDTTFNAPGFPRVFYLRYHGYSRFFPLWALAAYRNQHAPT